MSFPTWANGDVIYEGVKTNAAIPADRSRLSFVPCPIEWYAGFDTNAKRDNLKEKWTVWSKSRMFREHAGNLAVSQTLFGTDTDIDYSEKFLSRNSTVTSAAGAPTAGNVYTNPTSSSLGALKYDLMVRKKPKQPSPMGTLPAFTDTGGVQDGSNCVGIISARQRIYKSNGGSLNIQVQSVFGGPGFQISVGINRTTNCSTIGGLRCDTNTFVQPKTIYDPYWGNTSTRIDALGSTSLRVQVWDAWPPVLTLWVAQYYTALHFNPGRLGSSSSSKVYSIDMVVPPLDVGETVDENTTEETLPDVNEWDIDTSRRGMCVTGGMKYDQKTICFDDSNADIRVAGKGYAVGDIIENVTKNVRLKVLSVTSDGGVSSWEFDKDSENVKYNGEDLERKDFENGGPTLSFPKSGATQTCLIKFTQGKVENKTKTEGPKQHVPGQVLTPPAKGDTGSVGVNPRSLSQKTVTLPPNPNAPQPGAYDLFYHFQSDPAANPRNYALWGRSSDEDIKHVTITIS